MKDWRPGCTLASGGWGSGKTWSGARKFLLIHRYNQCPGMVLAPTWADLARLPAAEIMATCEQWKVPVEYWPHGHGRKQYPHIHCFGNDIYLFSGDAPERITGVQVGHAWADEAARFQTNPNDPVRDAPKQIRGRIRHPGARFFHWVNTTTPEGLDTWIQRDFFDKPLPGHRAYFLPTAGNRALSPEYVATIKATIPASLQAQYLEGIAVNYSTNRAHPAFKEALHLRDVPWRPNVPVHIGCDFNVSPMCWVALQEQQDGSWAVVDELVIDNHAQVDSAVHQANAKGWGHYQSGGIKLRRKVIVHPDKSSKNRSTTGDPELTVLQSTARSADIGWDIECPDAYGANPPVNSRINNLERAFMDAAGVTRLRVHPRCKRLAGELNRTGRLGNGYDPGKDKQSGHILDALGYAIWDALRPTARVETMAQL